jgi:hypothetical protein
MFFNRAMLRRFLLVGAMDARTSNLQPRAGLAKMSTWSLWHFVKIDGFNLYDVSCVGPLFSAPLDFRVFGRLLNSIMN